MRFTNEYPYRRRSAEAVASYTCRTEGAGQTTANDEYTAMSKDRLLHTIDALTFVKGIATW